MKIRACPLCRQVILLPRGAAVNCGTCSFPVTRHTLSMISDSEIETAERTTDFQRR